MLFKFFTGEDESEGQISFIGVWQGGSFDGNEIISESTWTFYSNGSLKETDDFGDEWFIYEIRGGELCRMQPEISFTMCYNYQFSNGNKQFTLYLGDFPNYRFNKI